MRHFKKIDWPVSLSLLFACVLTVIAACVEPSGPLGAPHVIEGGGGTPVASVQITLAQSTLAPGKTTQATVVAKSADGKIVDGQVDFSSQNLSIATVSSNGVVTAVAVGIAVIQATVAGHGATAPVTVQSIVFPIAAVAVAIDSTKISVGHVAQASAVVKDTTGNPITGQTVTWSSLTPNVASVSSSGTVTAIAAGTASIEATASGVNGSASIIVEAPQSVAPSVASVAVAFDSTRISVGHATQASAVVKDATGSIMAGQAITWSSLTPGIASVSSSGVVTAIAAGTASIRATASGVNGSASILVVPPPVAVVIVAVDSPTLSIGHTAQAHATAKDLAGNTISGQTILWSSLSPSVATVSSVGVVSALTVGMAEIQATVSGVAGRAAVTVTDPTIPPPTSGAPDLAFNDFNTTTSLDPSSLPYKYQYEPGDLDFPNDPTGSGRGKVARFHYVKSSLAPPSDVNRSITYVHDVHWGETMYFRGEVYLPISSFSGADRKLLYWQPDVQVMFDKYGAARTVFMVVGILADGNLGLGVGNEDNAAIVNEELVPMAGNTWYTIELRITNQSAPGVADGIVQMWLNGTLLSEHTALSFVPSSWIGVPIPGGNGIPLDAADLYWSHYQIGDQVNGAILYDEYRYWDNCGFSTTRIGP